MRSFRLYWLFVALGIGLTNAAQADVQLSKLFGDHMVLQRDKPVAVFGTADPGEKVSVVFGSETISTKADARGNWRVLLPAMPANTRGQTLTVKGSNIITVQDVLVGDVWLCSGQSNMDMGLAACNRPEDIAAANFSGIRSFRVPLTAAGEPLKGLKGDPKWIVCSPRSAGGFSAAAFYFARSIYQTNDASIPIGLIVSAVGGTAIDLWLSPEGLIDVPALRPLLDQPVLPDGPFHLANGMIAPLAPYGIKGAIWYQGENAERTVQSPDSYFLKMKAMVQGWKQLFGMDDFPFYYVMIANYGELLPTNSPVLHSGGWDADTRLQQVEAMALPHAGCASAMDIGVSKVGWPGYHPENKQDVGERLALWALKNDYGHPDLVASGPVLKDVSVAGNTVVCFFDHIGSGLMVGHKTWYKPTEEVVGGTLKRFVIAGADGKWFPAIATIKDNQVLLSSPSVAQPRKVAYACWQNPEGCNLYNREGLPAAPFYVEDVTTHHRIIAKAGGGGEIRPSGARQLLERMTALYMIEPKPGYFIEDVKVDGASVGSVPNFTFDPVYGDHTIEATFARKAPTYQITTVANEGGSVRPSGSVAVPQGGAQAFSIMPKRGMSTRSVTVDGVALGPREDFALNDVRRNHTLGASFACKISAEAGYGGGISPCGEVMAEYNGTQTFRIVPIPGYSIANVRVDEKDLGARNAYTFAKIASSHSISVQFKSDSVSTGKIPRTGDLLVAARANSLPAAGGTGVWPTLFPEGGTLTPISTPRTVTIADRKFSRNQYLDGDGFNFESYSKPIPCNGASIVVVARPMRSGAASGWFSIVDVFYDRLVLGIRNDTGRICVRRNGSVDVSEVAIPDGQTTLLSLIVQPDGSYKVFANGVEVMANSATSPMTLLVPGVAGSYATSITVGRNAPDAWTTFNGDIGDVFVYKTALLDDERQHLEAFIANSLVSEKEGKQ